MRFRTEYEARPAASQLDPTQSIVLIGSCFTDYIGECMRSCRWRAYHNITGTLFNPSSIAMTLDLACRWDHPSDEIKDSLANRERLWVSWLTDSGCSTYSKQETEDLVFGRLRLLRDRLAEAHALIVTFGTAWIYELKERPGYVVANCHKFHSDAFIRRRLTVMDIVEQWNAILSLLGETYPELKVIFTVSPVRHLKDGFEGNSRSKAILQLACEEICCINEKADYFPSFEIMNDDLRDYRFYSSDLVHPSPEAVDYIWEKFQDRFLSKESRALLAEGERVTKRLNHRPVIRGNSELAHHMAAIHVNDTTEVYNAFMAAHPGMLPIDE